MGAEGHSSDFVFNHQCRGGRGVEGLRPTKLSSSFLHTSGNVPACVRLGPQCGQLGDTFIIMFISISSHAVPFLVSDTARAGPTTLRIILITSFMPFVMSGMLGTKFSFHSRYHHHLVSLQHTTCFLPFFSPDLVSSAESISV